SVEDLPPSQVIVIPSVEQFETLRITGGRKREPKNTAKSIIEIFNGIKDYGKASTPITLYAQSVHSLVNN
ncbi:hypothetical protein NPIL_459341, partial [Nephila pilipes]